MNSQDYYRIISRYKDEILNKNTDAFNEKSLLSSLKNSIEWSEYTEEEKHNSHKVVLSVARKTNNFKQFEFEISIIEIYDLLISVKDSLANQEANDIVFRLLSIIDICKYYKSEYRDLRRVNIYPLKVLSEYIKNYKEQDVLMEIKPTLNELIIKIDTVPNLGSAD